MDMEQHLLGLVPDEDCTATRAEQAVLAGHVLGVLNTLPRRQRLVLIHRFGLRNHPPLTQQQVSRKMGISRSYVSRLEKKAVETLRSLLQI